jgi:hypothetical protein
MEDTEVTTVMDLEEVILLEDQVTEDQFMEVALEVMAQVVPVGVYLLFLFGY